MWTKLWVIGTAVILLGLAFFVWASVPSECEAQGSCPEPAAYGHQPYPTEMANDFLLAGINRLGEQGPDLPEIWKGYPPEEAELVSPYAPCILLYAIGYTESTGWKQFIADYGQDGYTVISGDCGYGIMQITSGMGGGAGFDPSRVASEPAYNIGTGTRLLIEKWNIVQNYIGNNNPAVVEDWYYAVWAYNEGSVGSYNNPNRNCPTSNPECGYAFNPNRPSFNGSQPRSWYPYQELIWGYAANPPSYNGTTYWQPIPLTLPPRASITDPPPTHIDRPLPSHGSCSVVFLPVVENYCENPDTYEPNNSFSAAYSINFGQWYFSYIWYENDNDWYKFYVTASSTSPKYINVWLQGIPTSTDYDLDLYSPSNQLLAQSHAGGNSNEYISKRVTQSGWYRARIFPYSGFSKCSSYRLWVSVTTK